MSAENTRPNPGNVINRIRDDIPKSFNSTRRSRASIGNYGSEDESQLDTLVCHSYLFAYLALLGPILPGPLVMPPFCSSLLFYFWYHFGYVLVSLLNA